MRVRGDALQLNGHGHRVACHWSGVDFILRGLRRRRYFRGRCACGSSRRTECTKRHAWKRYQCPDGQGQTLAREVFPHTAQDSFLFQSSADISACRI